MSERLPGDDDGTDDSFLGVVLGCIGALDSVYIVVLLLIASGAYLLRGEIADGLPLLIVTGAVLVGIVVGILRWRRRRALALREMSEAGPGRAPRPWPTPRGGGERDGTERL
jgi:hypothetical protein